MCPRDNGNASKNAIDLLVSVIIGTVIFPFWNLIRADVYEEVEIMGKWSTWYGTMCSVDTSDNIPKTIDNCDKEAGDVVTVKYGKDLAYAEIVNP